MGQILDHVAHTEVFDDAFELPVRSAFNHYGFQRVHVGVGTSDVTDHVASFWFLDTGEILSFAFLMYTFAVCYTFQLWSYLCHMRWWYKYTGVYVPPANLSAIPRNSVWWNMTNYTNTSVGQRDDGLDERLALVHCGAVCCGWTLWLGVALLVMWRQWRDAWTNDPEAMPKLTERRAPSVWTPAPGTNTGEFPTVVRDVRPQPLRFMAPITCEEDGQVLYSHEELVDDLVFGNELTTQMYEKRARWKDRLNRWYPPSCAEGLDWALARRALVEDARGRIMPLRPLPGRYFIDYDEGGAEGDVMRGKQLRRVLWIVMWLPCGTAGICEIVRYWVSLHPQTAMAWISFAISFLTSLIIMWLQVASFGARIAESVDRGGAGTDNVFVLPTSRGELKRRRVASDD